ncbi:MAG TPA: PLD nuclease N-terminal domain-containing protein [Dermatophilaceae bacterium]|nr:PLD nuclease N-terminal domain-containing protein [Dermatophilaceae bacterium]
MIRVLAGVAVFALTVYAAVDCIQTEHDRVRNLPKIAWVLIVLLFTPIGPIAWFLAGRPDGNRDRLAGGWDSTRRPPRGPDDDPDFLRSL